MINSLLARLPGNKNMWVFILLWLLTFVLYIPAGKAGWVIDGAGFLYHLKHQGFWDFINRTTSTDQSFYQLFTLHYVVFYKLWGINPWLWTVLYITLQAINALLFFIFATNILDDSAVKNGRLIAFCGVIIFTVSPHISEIIVCKAYYHYLQCFLFILLIMLWVQKYQHTQRSKYIWGAILLFVMASLTLEIFYLVPVFVLSIALYYRFALNYDKTIFRRTVLYFFIPQVILLGIYFIALKATFNHLHPHKIEINQTLTDYLSKLPKYLFHILFLGRYFSFETKKTVYALFESTWALITVYALLAFVFGYAILRLKKISNDGKAMFFFFVFSMVTICFVMPLSFPDAALLIFYDRYTYFADPFLYVLLVLVITRLVRNKYLLIGLFCIYFDINLYFLISVNTSWIQSDVINTRLLRNFPNDPNKTVLLLDIPENMNGAPMIGAQPDGMFKIMREIYTDTLEKNTVYDVMSYNMSADYDGAHVKVLNDSMVRVNINHGGNWWWYEGHGGQSYETADFKVNMINVGVYYDLTLKHPADHYLLLFSVGDKWKQVDWNKKNVNQD